MSGLCFFSATMTTATTTTTFAVVYLFLCSLLITKVAADIPHHNYLPSYQAGEFGTVPAQGFFSSPIKAPLYHVSKFDIDKIDPTPYIFITGGYEGFGPSIISSKDLSLIWADQQYSDAQAHRTYTFLGQPVCAVFAGGVVRIYNQHYQMIYEVRPQGNLAGITPDSHEALLTHDNTVVMIVSRPEDADLTILGDPGVAPIINCHIQEVDPVTNEVKFQFNTMDFFHVEDSFWPIHGEGVFDLPGPPDMWHMNSVEKTEEGDFIVSYRHLHSIILIDGKTGQVKWVLGGKRNQFRDITEGETKADFHWQHNARFSGPGRITLFDNHNIHNGWCKQPAACSRGLELELDTAAMTVRLAHEWRHPQRIVSASRGGVQRTPRGNVLVAWGQNPMYTEYTADGELAMDVQRGQVLEMDHGVVPVIAYRAWKADWVGRPLWDPSIAAVPDPDRGTVNIYVSWNGATEVHRYVLLMSNDIRALNGGDAVVARSPRTGFETAFVAGGRNSTTSGFAFARVAALDRDGAILGATAAVYTPTGDVLALDYPVDDVDASARQARARARVAATDVPAAAVAGILLTACFSVAIVLVFCRPRRSQQVVYRERLFPEEEGLMHSPGAARE
ncbi:ASST-domain-containing protein [Biscogniauxia sp. FL1348]|nr:ASST-domain-containing protein [Biscogniauxia sp. FL1348]